jgi:hypothetical protein
MPPTTAPSLFFSANACQHWSDCTPLGVPHAHRGPSCSTSLTVSHCPSLWSTQRHVAGMLYMCWSAYKGGLTLAALLYGDGVLRCHMQSPSMGRQRSWGAQLPGRTASCDVSPAMNEVPYSLSNGPPIPCTWGLCNRLGQTLYTQCCAVRCTYAHRCARPKLLYPLVWHLTAGDCNYVHAPSGGPSR